MPEVLSTIIGIIISSFSCGLVLNIFNNKILDIFTPIQNDLAKLTKMTRMILSLLYFIFIMIIVVLLYVVLDITYFEAGLIIGCLQAIKDICFKLKTPMKIK